jgi:hypothetical protein
MSSIRLIVPEKLSTSEAKQWFQCVKTQLPSGLIGSTTLYSKSDLKPSSFWCRKLRTGKWCYHVPLVRDLDSSEIHQLVECWNKAYPKGDFLVDYTQNPQPAPGPQRLEQGKIQEVLDSWAKAQHNTWMENLLNKGWKFGLKLSTQHRTHPLIQPWEQLPTYAREKNLQAVESLLEILGSQGYTITQKLEA